MDHLSDASGIVHNELIEVRCRLPSMINETRTLSDFWDLPKNEGWIVEEDGTKKTTRATACTFDQLTQKWLYFEILAQVFSHLSSFDMRSFIKQINGKEYITTSELPDLLRRWQSTELADQGIERTRRLIRIQQVLERARHFVSQYCSVMDVDDRPTWNVDYMLSLSIMVLGETLVHAQRKILQAVDFNISGWCSQDARNQGWGYSKQVLTDLIKRDRWCRRAIRKLQAQLRGNSIGLCYLHVLKDCSAKGPDHDRCKSTECLVEKFGRNHGLPDPKPYHHCNQELSDHCSEGVEQQKRLNKLDCDEWKTVNTKELATVIRQGNIPLFSFNRDNTKLELIKMRPTFDKSYAIFSHVWSDGFGTFQDQNKLSTCTLRMFSILFDKVNEKLNGRKLNTPEAFWIDTLSIPVGKDFTSERTLAIRQMHDIYLHARYTIILDKGLMKVRQGPGYSQPAMYITMSNWMTRMWTLQEAVLSKDIYVNFKNYIYSMKDLEGLYGSEAAALHTCIPLLSQTYWHGILGSKRDRVHTDFLLQRNWKPQANFIAAVWKATQWRSTDHGYHETLALATLFNLNIERFAAPMKFKEGDPEYARDCDNRMRDLLNELSAISPSPIPPGMIFLPGPRLSTQGYRWAPRTWLSSQEVDSPDPLSLSFDGLTSNTTTRLIPHEGLEVKFPGFVLHDLKCNRKKLRFCDEFPFPINSSLLVWYNVTMADDNDHFPEATTLGDRELAIIAARLPITDLKEIALLVAIKKCHAAIKYVEILNRVWLSREERQGELTKLSTGFRECSINVLYAAEQLPASQSWCVDGSLQAPDIAEPLVDRPRSAPVDLKPLSKSKKSQTLPEMCWSFFENCSG